MMGYNAARSPRRYGGTIAAGYRARNRFDGYQFSLIAPPANAPLHTTSAEPYTVRSVTPSLRPLVARYNGRCPECAGPLVSGEACVACPVCGFRLRG